MAPSTVMTAAIADAGASGMRCARVQDRLELYVELASKGERSLRLWRVVMYTSGLLAVVAAAAAGLSSLGSLWGPKWAGGLALAAAVLTSVDKFLGASDKITKLDRRWQSLEDLEDRALAALIDARAREERLDAGDATALAGYDAWLDEVCGRLDARLEKLNARLERV